MHFFPKTGKDFPFFLHREAREEHCKIENAIQLSFSKLMKFQRNMKRKHHVSEYELDGLLMEINRFFVGTNAIWTKTLELEIDEFDFFVFNLESRSKIKMQQNLRRIEIHDDLPQNISFIPVNSDSTHFQRATQPEPTPFFRPWL